MRKSHTIHSRVSSTKKNIILFLTTIKKKLYRVYINIERAAAFFNETFETPRASNKIKTADEVWSFPNRKRENFSLKEKNNNK